MLTGLAAVAGLGVHQVIAAFWSEPRPFATLSSVIMLLPHSADSAFPGDHAVIAGTLLFARRRGIVGAVVAGLAIGAVVALIVVRVGVRVSSRLATL